MQFVVNHLGHFISTNRLLERLIAAPQGRVVVVGSMRIGKRRQAAFSSTICRDLVGSGRRTPTPSSRTGCSPSSLRSVWAAHAQPRTPCIQARWRRTSLVTQTPRRRRRDQGGRSGGADLKTPRKVRRRVATSRAIPRWRALPACISPTAIRPSRVNSARSRDGCATLGSVRGPHTQLVELTAISCRTRPRRPSRSDGAAPHASRSVRSRAPAGSLDSSASGSRTGLHAAAPARTSSGRRTTPQRRRRGTDCSSRTSDNSRR